MTRFKRAQDWLCRRGKHDWVTRHEPIWNGGYMQCEHCALREVHGGESAGPAAWWWIQHAVTPPPPNVNYRWNHTDWAKWTSEQRARFG